jgi:hypothetical protein
VENSLSSLRRDFKALQKEHEELKAFHYELVGIIKRVTDELRGFVETEQNRPKRNSKTIVDRLKGHYKIFDNAFLVLSHIYYEQ